MNPVSAQPVKQLVSEPGHQKGEEPVIDLAADEYYNEEEEFDRDLAVAISASLEGAFAMRATQFLLKHAYTFKNT